MHEIDFVIPWVDGNDPLWQAEKAKYANRPTTADAEIRFRDWGLLPYWFRGVEQFAPWVRKVHLITWGHVPSWLKTDHPKLHIVRHQDYIPAQFLPTFSSHVIEWNMQRIEGLAEHFVYFNDDMFLLSQTTPETFFQHGLPCDSAILSPVIVTQMEDIGTIALNNMCVINAHFSKRSTMRQNILKWYSPKYGAELLRTLALSPWNHFPGFYNHHLPQPFLKTTFDTLWKTEPALLSDVCGRRFRDYHLDVNQWLARYWQFCEGHFVPVSSRRRRDLPITDSDTLTAIRQQRYQMICINDTEAIHNFLVLQHEVQAAFASLLPTPCTFEKP